jgi:thiamine-phosphate pyrophosphorylase
VTVSEALVTMISDRRRLSGVDLPTRAGEAARAGVDLIQVREKDLGGRRLSELVAQVVAATRGTEAGVLVNGRADIALAAGARGVQLPGAGLPVGAVRRHFPGLLIGASCHTLEQALQAEDGGADFVLLGPVFETPGKQAWALGAQRLAEVVSRLRIPVHAVGGIDAETARAALDAGARGLAAIRQFLGREPLEPVVKRLRGASP